MLTEHFLCARDWKKHLPWSNPFQWGGKLINRGLNSTETIIRQEMWGSEETGKSGGQRLGNSSSESRRPKHQRNEGQEYSQFSHLTLDKCISTEHGLETYCWRSLNHRERQRPLYDTLQPRQTEWQKHLWNHQKNRKPNSINMISTIPSSRKQEFLCEGKQCLYI